MAEIPELLKQNIEAVIEQAGGLVHAEENGLSDEELMRKIETAMPEISLMAFVTADGVERANSPDSFLMGNEIALRLRDIAFLCLDVQESNEPAFVRKMIQALAKRADSIAGMAGLPPFEAPEDLWLEPAMTSQPSEEEALVLFGGKETNTEEWLKRTIRVLRELLASLVLERDHLVNVELRDIQTAYMREVGALEAEAYQAECEVRTLKARLEMMQSIINREEPIDLADIAEKLRIQLEKFQKELDELANLLREADEYARKRERQRKAKSSPDGKDSGEDRSANTQNGTEAIQEKRPAQAEETEEQELKRLYRMIVKAMHPDLHPDQDEATKDLFKRAIRAYKEFDLKTLREIAAMLACENTEDVENIVEELLKERKRLLELIRGIRADIRTVKSRYPYTLKAILDDPVRLAEKKQSLKQRIEKAERAADVYRRRIKEMESQNG